MICYEIRVAFEGKKKSEEGELEEKMQRLNAGLAGAFSDEDGYAFAFQMEEELLVAAAYWPDRMTFSAVCDGITEALRRDLPARSVRILETREITTRKYTLLVDEVDNRCYIKRSNWRGLRNHEMGYYDNSYFHLEEELLAPASFPKEQALVEAEEILADDTLREELDRIYALENREKFYGHPVHYHIQAGELESAMPMVRLAVRALYEKKRLLSTRVSVISRIDAQCYNEKDVENVIRHARGAAVVVELAGTGGGDRQFATGYEAVAEFFAGLIRKYHDGTLFFLVELVPAEGFSKDLLVKAEGDADLIPLREGSGDRESAKRYLKNLILQSPYGELMEESYEEYLSGRRSFRAADIHIAFRNWSREVLRKSAYPAYRKVRTVSVKKEEKKKDAYACLSQMVGLGEIKEVTDQIIASYKMQKVREKLGMDHSQTTKHMIFTGNPGSAKTTVARLLADIFSEEGILKSGAFVECGRNDLVGKYVGWTAKIVAEKFRKASGGLLFIDEAYALADESGSFGDEAIHTIVREMENRRNDCIVIFAGYKDRMETFLDRNEGLRSRIAFHLDFPDYGEEELCGILDLMLRERNLTAEPAALEKCRQIFEAACGTPDFGNGRFVRNLVEQAVLAQAKRLMGKNGSRRITRGQAGLLLAQDFDGNLASRCRENVHASIGFRA
ncbi:MAG: AAA family ATPase [Lachnospiraceae bacterium]|nr:AAA family ATPase [Lachnospiraceae bacterium]